MQILPLPFPGSMALGWLFQLSIPQFPLKGGNDKTYLVGWW